jgi:site-specific recombinase XerC
LILQCRGLFKEAGIRLSELAGLRLDDVSPASREATVTGKGDKQRIVPFTYDSARAADRYSRERARHPMTRVLTLWLGVRGGPMTQRRLPDDRAARPGGRR